jgi:hypothetical protein
MTGEELSVRIEDVLHQYAKDYVYGTITKCLMDDIRTELSKFNLPESSPIAKL